MSSTKEKVHHHPAPMWATLAAGGCAGAISRTLTAPLDRVKVLVQEGRIIDYVQYHPTLQVRPDGHKKQVRLRKVLRYIYREGGVGAFWKGNGVNCMKAGPEFALVFSIRQRMALYCDKCRVYTQQLKGVDAASQEKVPAVIEVKQHKPSLFFRGVAGSLYYSPTWFSNIIIGAIAGGTAQTIMYPLELIKTRMAVSGKGEYLGVFDCVNQSYQRNGIPEFYKGLSANLVGIIPYRGLEVGMYFTIQSSVLKTRQLKKDQQLSAMIDPDTGKPMDKYDLLKLQKKHREDKLSSIEVAVIGTGSSVIAQTVTYPLNLIRTRLQTQGVNGRPVLYTGMTDCFKTVLRTEGMMGLFHGLSANYMKAVPASAITFVVFDKVQSTLANVKLTKGS